MSLSSTFRISFLLLFFWASVQMLCAQEQYEDVLYLKDGSVLRGQIVEQVIGDHIKIELLGGSVMVYSEAEVEKISREARKVPVLTPAAPPMEIPPITARPEGVYNLFSFALAFGTGFTWTNKENLWVNPSFTYRLGYRKSQYLNLGAGLGIDFYQGGVIMPIFIDYHGELGPERRVMPHYFANLGYGAAIGESWDTRVFRGGGMVHIGGGYKINTRHRSEWMFTFGYKAQQTYQEREIWLDPWGGGSEPIIATGTRLYQKIVAQLTIGF